MITSEKRFGPAFCTGKEEEPSPFAYTLRSSFERQSRSNGTFSLAPRESPAPKPAFESEHEPALPGAFPNVVTTDQLKAIEAERVATYNKFKTRQPRTKRGDVRVGAGPGSYNVERDTNPTRLSAPCSFPKEKRLDVLDFAAQRGWVSDSPGPKYLPTNEFVASSVYDQKHDRHALLTKARARNDALLREASASLTPSYKAFERSFERLNHSLSASAINSPHRGRVPSPVDIKQSGPGSYDATGTDFTVKRSKRGTFGTAKNLDLLSSLIAAGHAASTPTGPGDYNPQKLVSFQSKTFNARGGYVPQRTDVQTNLDSLKMKVPPNTSLLLTGHPSKDGHAPAKELWKAMMKSPDPRVLGYDTGAPSMPSTKAKSPKPSVKTDAQPEPETADDPPAEAPSSLTL
ncbi:hypothetical protein SDRG_14844 [Saprolegnia diclina VS20]|uniref:Uncharacterized protein n=1 Tax=Saprolegnia diclina (strain VS20) TaxID=1156394 RepID=T0PPE6_SAPDV|nr:hypothetical protein SDRG_14844 [Saprolegnia diclina VS20]EQC27319.1 hypothetical protein SDRG_14844 [Saprolegnia diclina VS20]|eukprot:XP_008619223.1 hypothetical protein SDRG_14844 [Saprolegnia diclina VS20]